jgi:hypothetical protein
VLQAPLRMMCEFVGREYENHAYVLTLKEGGGYDISDWLKYVYERGDLAASAKFESTCNNRSLAGSRILCAR